MLPHASWFAGTSQGLESLQSLLDGALAMARDGVDSKPGPSPAGGPDAISARTGHLLKKVLPEDGVGDWEALLPLASAFGWGSIDLTHPAAAAFLQPPALTVTAAADAVISALNQSVDVWDSGPFAIALEAAVIDELRDLVGLPSGATGVMTPGGSISNLFAVIIARDTVGSRLSGTDITLRGLQSAGRRLRVLCSTESHVSVIRAVAAAGLGDESIVTLPAERDGRLRAETVRHALAAMPPEDVPFLLVAMAGTTDLGAVDELPELAQIARDHAMWFHVDAAYGAGALFSPKLRPLFTGIELADSVTVDLHKLAWHPAPASALLVRHAADFSPLDREVAYLNPADDADAGLPHLLGRTLETTRRADALKAAAAFRSLGRAGFASLVERCHQLALDAAESVSTHPQLETYAPVVLTRLVFRYVPRRIEQADDINARLRRRLLLDGKAVLGRTTRMVDGVPRVHLKLTIINPLATGADIDGLIDMVVAAGRAEEEACAGVVE
jgi:L-2,4-diaminobutyrate decarboxylase